MTMKESLLSIQDDGGIVVDARLEAEKLEEQLKVKLPEGDFESVGGFIIHLLGRIPKIGEKIFFENFDFTIQKGDQRENRKGPDYIPWGQRIGKHAPSTGFSVHLSNLT